MERIKKFMVQLLVLVMNVALVGGGVSYFKNQQQQKKDSQDLANNSQANQQEQAIATKAIELQQIIDNNRNQKTGAVAANPSQITVQRPVTVTTTVPAVTTQTTVQKTTKRS